MRLTVCATILLVISLTMSIAAVLMGIRASTDAMKREEYGTLKDEIWPSERTVLIRADNGIASQAHAKGASRLLDLDTWTSNVELYELHGSHFGILNPNSGLAEIMNKVLEREKCFRVDVGKSGSMSTFFLLCIGVLCTYLFLL
jgi:hypothetical protein